jgi:hypothetical protein
MQAVTLGRTRVGLGKLASWPRKFLASHVWSRQDDVISKFLETRIDIKWSTKCLRGFSVRVVAVSEVLQEFFHCAFPRLNRFTHQITGIARAAEIRRLS